MNDTAFFIIGLIAIPLFITNVSVTLGKADCYNKLKLKGKLAYWVLSFPFGYVFIAIALVLYLFNFLADAYFDIGKWLFEEKERADESN